MFDSPSTSIPRSSRGPSRELPDWSGALDNSLGALTLNVRTPGQNSRPETSTLDDCFPFSRRLASKPCYDTGRPGIRTMRRK